MLASVSTGLRGLGKTLMREAVPGIIEATRDVVTAQVARGEDPTGKRWKARKLDGGRPLKNAAANVEITDRRGVILMRITEHYAKHHVGAVKGKTRRRILPSSKLPSPYADAIREVLVRKFNETMGTT